MTIEGYQYKDQEKTLTQTQLTAPGSSEAIKTNGCKAINYQYTVAAINTSVSVNIQGSHDNTSWFILAPTEVKTSDGTYQIRFVGEIPFARFTFVAEAGGTAATIDSILFLE